MPIKKRKFQNRIWNDLGVVHDGGSQCIRAMCAKKKKEEELGNDQINCSYEIVMYSCLQLFI